MSRLFTIKVDDLEPAFEVELTENGKALNISSAAGVTFVMRPQEGGDAKVDAAGVIDDNGTLANRGIVRYVWTGTDTDTAGSYDAWFVLDWGSSRTQTFPPVGSMTVRIDEA